MLCWLTCTDRVAYGLCSERDERHRARGGCNGPAAGSICTEPFYATAMRMRNRLFDAGVLPGYPLGRPTISVGNLTAGGTGKTPMVRWLAERLPDGRHVAILARLQIRRCERGR